MDDKRAYGDYQTPLDFAAKVCHYLKDVYQLQPTAVLEPTCGQGNFLKSSLILGADEYYGIEIDPDYCEICKRNVNSSKVQVINADFFSFPLDTLIHNKQQVLVIGNPPWVTNSTLSVLNADNLPTKNNSQKLKGIDALTGESNFDISEAILLRLIEAFKYTNTMVAMLCKTAIARKVFQDLHSLHVPFALYDVLEFDARKVFGISFGGACLLVIRLSDKDESLEQSTIYDFAAPQKVKGHYGYVHGQFYSNLDSKVDDFAGVCCFTWRQGVKHDCAKVMELTLQGDQEQAQTPLPEQEQTQALQQQQGQGISRGAQEKKHGKGQGKELEQGAAPVQPEQKAVVGRKTQKQLQQKRMHEVVRARDVANAQAVASPQTAASSQRLWCNGYHEVVVLEDTLLYPLVKSSMFKSPLLHSFSKFVIVTQRKIGEDTSYLEQKVPQTWQYLKAHQADFAKRKSAIYRGAPPFAMFGIGDYSYAPYKVGLSAFYKRPLFAVLYDDNHKAVMVDDTCYFIGFSNYDSAYVAMLLLNSARVQRFLASMVFLDAKRPYTKKVLAHLDFRKIVTALSLTELVQSEQALHLSPYVTAPMYEDFQALVHSMSTSCNVSIQDK